tara:strand:+ start:4893 stop:6152 length:1260 start_codon:yes stop_codon:yes gene_type:complete
MNKFFTWKNLSQMHIELTNSCNAACPMCTRFFGNSPLIRPDLELGQITLDKFKKYFPKEVLDKMEVILFCGVHGDPGVAKDVYEICEYIAETNPETCVRMNTNGGMRNPEFWSKMGKLFASKEKGPWSWRITFSIDGLEDTNHLYRRNVVWDKLYANVKAYLETGAQAEWDFLIFKHNEHQLQEAKKLSTELGFYAFVPKKALGVDDNGSLRRMPAVSREGELEYYIDAPIDPNNRNIEEPIGEEQTGYWNFDPAEYKSLRKNRQTPHNYQDMVDNAYAQLAKEDNTQLDTANIKCKAKTRNSGIEIFVDNFGRVMPCCYAGTHLVGTHGDGQSLQLHHETQKYGWDNFNLELHSLKDIMLQGHLDRLYTDSWQKPSCDVGKMAYCANICGTYSRVDRIWTHEDMTDKSRNWRETKNNE